MIVNIHDAKTNLSKYLAMVSSGEEMIISNHGKPMYKVEPVSVEPRKPGFLKGEIWMSDDFDEPMMWLWDLKD